MVLYLLITAGRELCVLGFEGKGLSCERPHQLRCAHSCRAKRHQLQRIPVQGFSLRGVQFAESRIPTPQANVDIPDQQVTVG